MSLDEKKGYYVNKTLKVPVKLTGSMDGAFQMERDGEEWLLLFWALEPVNECVKETEEKKKQKAKDKKYI